VNTSITINTKDFPNIEAADIDSEGEITLAFKVVGISKNDDEFGDDEGTYYTLSCTPIQLKIQKMSLEEAGDKAAVRVKTQVSPAP